MKNYLKISLVAASIMLCGQAFAATGGGATIHNVARLTFTGGEAVAWVNVEVATIATAPTITVVSDSVNSGETGTVTYTVASNSNGSDHYSFGASSSNTGVSAPGALTVDPAAGLTLGASIVLSAQSLGGNVGQINVPAGSEGDFTNGDTVRINVSGTDYLYKVTNVVSGTPASTSGNVTTPEVNSVITLESLDGAPEISNANVPAGTQVGEVNTVKVTLTAGSLTAPGTPGEHGITITVTTSETDGGGNVVTSTDTTGKVTVLSGTANLIKQVRNVTTSSAWFSSTTGSTLTAKSGEKLEYRLSVTPIAGETVLGATLKDSIPVYTTYFAGSTTLNGVAVADVGADSALLAGMPIHSPTGSAVTSQIIDGETAIVLFTVIVK